MEHPNSGDTAANNRFDDAANRINDAEGRHDDMHSDNPETAADMTEARPSAIERQMAAAPEFAYRDSPRRTLTDHTADRYIDDYSPVRRRRRRRFGPIQIVLLLLLVAAGLSLLFVKLDNPLLQAIATHSPSTGEVARSSESSAAANSSTAESSPAINSAADSNAQSVSSSSADISPTPTDSVSASANNGQSQSPQSISQTPSTSEQENSTDAQANSNSTQENLANAKTVAAPNAISIPTSDISLRDRPELLEQLVPIYRAQLASDPNNSAARNALEQLQERSLSELQTIVLAGDDATAVKLLEMVARLFPEAADSARYKYLAARMDRVHRQKSDGVTAHEQSPSSASNAPSVAAAMAATNSPAAASVKKSAQQKTAAAPAVAKTSENSGSTNKPEIHSVVMTPGTMVNSRFVPSSGGNVFMVELSYRNFDRAFVGEARATLITRIGAPGESLVLAEAPVVITADRGTKNFLIETTSVQGYIGGTFQLNFILNDEFLASRTVRLSLPER